MKKKYLIASSAVLALIAIIGGVAMKSNYDKALREQEQQQLTRAYARQRSVFGLGGPAEYKPLPDSKYSDDGVLYGLYFELAYYRQVTGESLTYDDVKEYLSREYEDDGEIRIYTNGRHPEIAKYIEWDGEMERYDAPMDYRISLVHICAAYYESKGFDVPFEKLYPNRAVMDEVIKKEADPSYVMNDEIMLAHLGGVKD